jgi:hypothetical protein
MTAVRTADRVVVTVTATGGGDWQVVSIPTGYRGVVAGLFAENDYLHGFVRHEDGAQWEVYDNEDGDNSKLLQVTSISGTVTIARPATPFASSKSDGSRMDAGSGSHTLTISLGSGTLKRLLRESSPFWKTFTSGDATPSVADYRLFKTAGTTDITRFDDLKSGQIFWVRRGASDITITHDGTNIDLFGSTSVTLTAGAPAICFAVESGVAKQIAGGAGGAPDDVDFLKPTIAALKSVSAAEFMPSGALLLVAGETAFGDCPPFYVQWSPSSSATADDALVFRPTAGTAASGNGRWLRTTANPNRTFTSSDATPSIKNGNYFTTAGSTTITAFDDAHEGQMWIVQRGASDITIAHDGSNIDLGGANLTLTAANPRATFMRQNGVSRLLSSLGGYFVRVDTAAQGLTSTQKSNARTNIDANFVYDLKIHGGATGTAGDNATAAFVAAAADTSGRRRYIPAGTYDIDFNAVSITTVQQWDAHPAAIIRPRGAGTIGPAYGAPNYTVTRSDLIEFAAGSAGSTWNGGQFDGRRADLTTFATEYTSQWMAILSTAENVTVSNVVLKNWNVFPVQLEANGCVQAGLRIEDCGQGVLVGLYKSPTQTWTLPGLPQPGLARCVARNIVMRNIDNAGKAVFQHAIDVKYAPGAIIENVHVESQGGDRSGYSVYASGMTSIWSPGMSVRGFRHDGFTSRTLGHLAISHMNSPGSTFDDFQIRNCRDIGVEVNGASHGTIFSNFLMERGTTFDTALYNSNSFGGYLRQSAPAITYHASGQYPQQENSRRIALTNTDNILFDKGVIIGYGRCNLQGEGVKIGDVIMIGMVGNAMEVDQWSTNGTFGAAYTLAAERTQIDGATVINCGGRAISGQRFQDLSVKALTVYNPCQDAAVGTRYGAFFAGTSSGQGALNVQGLRITDDQGATVTNAITFQPQTSDEYGQVYATALKTGLFNIGMRFSIANADGAGNAAIVTVVAERGDELALWLDPPATVGAPGSTTNLAGTWTTDGTTATKLNGVGGQALTQIKGRRSVNVAGVWRDVVHVEGDNTIYINTAFPSPLTSATLAAYTLTLSATGNVTNLSGTWTTDGTDPTKLNGTGGNANPEIEGPLWVKSTVGSEWRQITDVPATSGVPQDNTIFVGEAFTSALSGATLHAIRASITTIKGMQYGLHIDETNMTSVYQGGNDVSGASVLDYSLGTQTKYRSGARAVLVSPSAPVAGRFASISAVANNGSGKMRYTATAHNLTTGWRGYIAGVSGGSYTGSKVITVIDANTFDVESDTYSGTPGLSSASITTTPIGTNAQFESVASTTIYPDGGVYDFSYSITLSNASPSSDNIRLMARLKVDGTVVTGSAGGVSMDVGETRTLAVGPIPYTPTAAPAGVTLLLEIAQHTGADSAPSIIRNGSATSSDFGSTFVSARRVDVR